MQKENVKDIITLENMLNENKNNMQQDQIAAFDHAIRALRFKDCIQQAKLFIATTKKPITRETIFQLFESCDKTVAALVDKTYYWTLINDTTKSIRCPICRYRTHYDEKGSPTYCERCGIKMAGVNAFDFKLQKMRHTYMNRR